jgi:hypothetical protein
MLLKCHPNPILGPIQNRKIHGALTAWLKTHVRRIGLGRSYLQNSFAEIPDS